MTLPALSAEGSFSPPIESHCDSAAILGNLTAALARGELAQGTQLMEHALLLNVQWEQLTTAVQDGIAQGYELPKDTRETR